MGKTGAVAYCQSKVDQMFGELLKARLIGCAAPSQQLGVRTRRGFSAVKDTLQQMVPLSHPSTDKIICLYTDPSDTDWVAFCTLVPSEDLKLVMVGLAGQVPGGRWWNRKRLRSSRRAND
ncbi:hypothetical protein H257_16284 [Aphanomyces astaci]|uniref:Uncharacterized protein n=1 Tax=Aphanomyces astaci TaxID=112090 RepID=W4FLL0_APHAT|nr:hypothetical protein H257_16284 [Aphanomyces astaci]ETV67553.1 hypothetical protein H257_16284 [Aphanomyces astaci]|eukprot:XP_009842957.1 hypothetical protein H257_16284 [Aphanomyces astaci]